MGFPLWPFWEQSLSGKEIYIYPWRPRSGKSGKLSISKAGFLLSIYQYSLP